jgi:hypothetical protein
MPESAERQTGPCQDPKSDQTPDQRSLMSAYHRMVGSILIVYDLDDPAQWTRAGQCVRGWGRERVEIHSLDSECVVVEFKPGGLTDLKELT